MRYLLHGIFWVGLYLLVTMLPLFALLIGPELPGRGFWRELSVGLGFAGLAMMGVQFFLTGRFSSLNAPYGIDVVYHFHRAISLIAFLFILLHPLLLISGSGLQTLFNPFETPWPNDAGLLALAGCIVLVASSLYRQQLHLSYEGWRRLHGYAALFAVTAAIVHMIGVNYYLQSIAKRGVWLGLAAAWILALVYVRLIKPFLLKRRPYTVVDVRPERGSSWTVTLRPDHHPGLFFRPGQFAWLTIGNTPFTLCEHPFSFSSSAMRPEEFSFTIKELGDFTATIGQIAVGSRAYVDGPYGLFTPDRYPYPGYVFFAGGVGITPIMSILRTLADRHDQRPLLLFYACRDLEKITFREELDRLKAQLQLRIVYTLNDPPPDWNGEIGNLDAALIGRHLPANRIECEYFVCGPPPMQKAVRTSLARLGVPLEQVQSESFNFV